MSSHGFGIPTMAAEFHSRILGGTLHGCEVLASCRGGWPLVVKRLNEVQHIVAKIFLSCPQSAHLGSHVEALAETRLVTRAATWLAKSIVMLRARLACLPLDHPARITACHRRFTNIPDTWMIASWEILTKDLKIEHDLSDTWSSIPIDVTKNPKARKLFVSNYCSNYVLPKMRQLDHAWFTGQLSKLNTDGLIPYTDLVPLHQCWTAREPVF